MIFIFNALQQEHVRGAFPLILALMPVQNSEDREYGQTEFFLTDDDGYSHCFGVPTR